MDIMWNINTDYIPNIRYKNEKNVIYSRIMKYVYVCIEYNILWCDLYENILNI